MLFLLSSGESDGERDTVMDGEDADGEMAVAADLLGLDIAIDGELFGRLLDTVSC